MVSHSPNGLSNATRESALYDYVSIDPTRVHQFFTDFDKYTASDWVITTTEAGSGSASEALADADGGVLVVTNDDADNDADFLQWAGGSGGVIESFKFESGKKLWFKSRFKVSDATQSDFIMGLQITDTTPLAVTDGVYFRKDDGDTNLDFVVIKDSTATTEAAISTVSDDTYLSVGFYYDGANAIHYFVNDLEKGKSVVTNLPDDEELTISFGIQNGEAAAKVMSVDYILAAKER